MKKIAIIGASYLQVPLIIKAKQRGFETHVFAWKSNDIGEKIADYFYPISIVEKENILVKCQEIGIDGVCSIASDLASITVNYVAEKMGLVGNSMESVMVSTNKHKMRKCFEKNHDPSPKSILVEKASDLQNVLIDYPVIVKPTDRSGSRGITKLNDALNIEVAIENAKTHGFEKVALVEEYVDGKEYSVEYISWKGEHFFLNLTEKYTTGEPNFIETGHLEPALVNTEILQNIKCVIEHALRSLGIRYGASHSEIKISDDGKIQIIEIGGRMGGDCIGSSLVYLSTGFDFVSAVIDISMGIKPEINIYKNECAAIHYIFSKQDIDCLNILKKENPELLVEEEVKMLESKKVTDSSSRFGYFIMKGDRSIIKKYMPK